MGRPLDEIGRAEETYPQVTRRRRARNPAKASFDDALDLQLRGREPERAEADDVSTQGVRFSRHAAARLESRGITLGDEEREELEDAIDQLAERGARESLVLMRDRAYVVGVPRRTVITVLDREEALGQVFTNIDSTFVAT